MGINGLLPVLKSIAKPSHIRCYNGQKVAVDGYSWLHKGVYCCSKELCEGQWTDKYVTYCMSRVEMLRQHGVEPVIIFDGGRLPLKAEEEDTRRRARQENKAKAAQHLQAGNMSAAYECYQRAVDVTPAMAKHLIEVLKAAAVSFIVAPYEADAQMAYLARRGDVHAVVTEDSDLLVYGCPRLFFKMDKTGAGEELRLQDLPHARGVSLAGFTADMFMQMCIMAGCDFLKQLQGIGMKTAHSHMRKFKSFVKVVRSLRFSATSVPRDYEQRFQMAIWVFRHQRVFCPHSRTMVHLNPLPAGGLGGADVDVLAALPEGEQLQALDFLGPRLPDHVAAGIAAGDLDPSTQQPFDLAAIFRGCTRLPPHLGHLQQLQQQQECSQGAGAEQAEGSQAQGSAGSQQQAARPTWVPHRPRGSGLSRSRGSGTSRPPLPANQHGIAQFLSRGSQQGRAASPAGQQQRADQEGQAAGGTGEPASKRPRLATPVEACSPRAPCPGGPSQDSLLQQLDHEFPMSQEQARQQARALQADSQQVPSWLAGSQEQARCSSRGQAVSALALLGARRSGGCLRRNSTGSVGSMAGSLTSEQAGSGAAGDHEVTSPLRSRSVPRPPHGAEDDEVICIDEPENLPLGSSKHSHQQQQQQQQHHQHQQAQAGRHPQPSRSPKLSRFFGTVLGGSQAQLPGTVDAVQALRSRLRGAGGLQQRQAEQAAAAEEQQQEELGHCSSQDGAGEEEEAAAAAGGPAAGQQDPIHSISHIKQFALLASAAISSVHSAHAGGGSSGGRQPRTASAAARPATGGEAPSARRSSLLSKPFVPPRQQGGPAGRATSKAGVPGKQRKPGAFNQFMFTQ